MTFTGPLSAATVGVTLAVGDMARAREFYEQQLGLTALPSFGGSDNVGYAFADGAVFNIYLSRHAGPSPATRVGFLVDDLHSVVAELSARGVSFEHYDGDGISTDSLGIASFGDAKVAYLCDPDGNMLSIASRPPV